MRKMNHLISCSVLIVAMLTPSLVLAHGDVIPQPVDTKSLPTLGPEWRDQNPFRGQKAAINIGTSAYAENCARCHGLQAESGGIAPDLRLLDRDCMDLKGDKQQACFKETDKYFLTSIRHGKVRNGAVYMPAFEGILNQEAMWSIKSYLETLRGVP